MKPLRPWPLRGWVGLVLVFVFWILNWSLTGLRTHWGFFPLWLGYCLTLDAWAWRRVGTSLWVRGRRHYVGLFCLSAPVWWVFEAINQRTENWLYLGRGAFTDLEYFLLASLSFSTVVPAVFGTAELASTFAWVRRLQEGSPAPKLHGTLRVGLTLAGFVMLVLVLSWPRYFFPLVWVSLFFVLDPINDALGHRSLFRYFAGREWPPIVALGAGCLICGFFWEMWNFFSYPKWTYQIPFVGFFPVFEMPILGYAGYVPFALELFAIHQLVVGCLSPDLARFSPRLRSSPGL